jgi:hypothetical protein
VSPATPGATLPSYPAAGGRYWGGGPVGPRRGRARPWAATWDLAAEEEPPGPTRLGLPGSGERGGWCGERYSAAYHPTELGDDVLLGVRACLRPSCPDCGGECDGEGGCVLGHPHLGGEWDHQLAAGLAEKMERFRREATSPAGCRLPPTKAHPDGEIVRYRAPRCPVCHGSMKWRGKRCPTCGGEDVEGAGTVNGWFQVIVSLNPSDWSDNPSWTACPACGGSGTLSPDRTCRRCAATGHVSSHVLTVDELRRLFLGRAREWAFPGVPVAGATFVHPWRCNREDGETEDKPHVCFERHPEYDIPGPHIHGFLLGLDIRGGATERYYERTTARCAVHAGTRWSDLKSQVPGCPDCREGHIVKVATIDGKNASPFKLYRGVELERAICYELSHVGVMKGKHSVTEFGKLKLLPTSPPTPTARVCPGDGAELTRLPSRGSCLSVEFGPQERPVIVHRVPGPDGRYREDWRRVCRAWDLDAPHGEDDPPPPEIDPLSLATELRIRPPLSAKQRELAREFNRSAERAARERLDEQEYRAGSGGRHR